jgi:hypothetical protein
MIYCLIDCAKDDQIERLPLPKAAWMVAIVLFPLVGSIAWLVVARVAIPRAKAPKVPPTPVAPDDDPEFLRFLDEQNKRRKGRNKKADSDPESTDGLNDSAPDQPGGE